MADDLEFFRAVGEEMRLLLDDNLAALERQTKLTPPERGLLDEMLQRDTLMLGRYLKTVAAVEAGDDPEAVGRLHASHGELRAAKNFWLSRFVRSWFEPPRECTWAARNPSFLPPGRSLDGA